MRAIPVAARVCVLGAALCAALCVHPALRPDTPWGVVSLLAALYAFCELPARWRYPGRSASGSAPVVAGSFFPVLLAAALLLPPAAAALVAVPGALLGRIEQRPRSARRIWRVAQLTIATWAAARAQMLFGGPVALGGGGYGLTTPDFPYVLLPAGAGALAFCLVLFVLDGGILVTAERLPPRTAWRGLLSRSLAPLGAHGLAGLMMAVLWRSPFGPLSALFVLLPMYISCWVFAQYHRERAAHQATIRALVQAVDIKDRYTRGHSERVGHASVLIAHELGMERERIEVLRFAGILHDVGKLGVPTRVLRKDGPLTPEERRVIELHPEYGHEMVRGIGFLGEARSAILHHHERLDGTGYPYGLAGQRIPEFARVVAVADAFDAMTSTRSYRPGRPVPTALAELERCAGTQFDPRMVRALVRALDRHGWRTAVTADEPAPPGPPPGPSPGATPAPSPTPSPTPSSARPAVVPPPVPAALPVSAAAGRGNVPPPRTSGVGHAPHAGHTARTGRSGRPGRSGRSGGR
ncbi:HD-GYP domain-containing protein [Streptomyces scopuliridis]|uniref:HD-GYP domain-containing protein n=1 Tax=Streptomyces scopuliridis TaxID=452529 RepID=UPI0036952DF4